MHGRYRGVGVQLLERRREPAGRHLHIGVEQHRVLRRGLLDGPVVTLGKAIVAVEQDEADTGEALAEHGHRVVRRPVVGYDHLGHVRRRMRHDRRQKLLEQLSPVPIQKDDRYFH